ncbi:MAG: SCO family protein [Rhodospirillaceae bacterium]|nr:SCO family protein [Rhodospirillaceae bacterium]
MGKRIGIALVLALGTVFILVMYLPGMRPQPRPAVTVSGQAAIGGPFTLEDSKGNVVTEAILNGHYSLVYFGYTFCPDICPLALQNMTQALQIAGPAADDVLPVFITIDPARDTKEVIAAYLGHFHPRMIGLTGTPEQIKAAESVYRVYAEKAPGSGDTPDYMMDHTGYIYLMDKQGQYVAHFPKDATALDIANRMRRAFNPS